MAENGSFWAKKRRVGRVNFNLYHYAGNSPVKYTDPDGRECGYVLDGDGAHGLGHAGMYVLNDGKYAFFEVIGISNEKNGIPSNATPGMTYKDIYGKDTIVLSNSPNSLPSPSMSSKLGFPENSGALLRIFEGENAKKNMEAYFHSAGFESGIQFGTTPQQDKVIYAAALSGGIKFSGYNLITNSCGIFARNMLTTSGSGIRPYNPWLKALTLTNCFGLKIIADNAIPKTIMSDLQTGNRCAKRSY